VRSPLLLIHADGDRVISYAHSHLLHEHRSKAGLPSELFTQTSSAGFVKGHNYFDYDNDVVRPSAAFLERVWSAAQAKAQSQSAGSAGSAGSGVETPPRAGAAGVATPPLTQHLVIPLEVVVLAQRVPPSWVGRYTDEQEVQYLGSTNIWKSVKCTSGRGEGV
jgi:hypothetical protein